MFNPWSSKCEVTVGPIDPENELRFTPEEFLKYIDRVRGNKTKNSHLVERSGNFFIHKTRFNYFDGKQQIGLACGEFTDLTVLQNLKRFVLQADVGFIVDNHGTGGNGRITMDVDESRPVSPLSSSSLPVTSSTLSTSSSSAIPDVIKNQKNDSSNRSLGGASTDSNDRNDHRRGFEQVGVRGIGLGAAGNGVHSDLYRRQIPRESLTRLLDMPIFHGTNVKNIVQSGKSYLYYLLTYLLANCMRMYVLPGPQLPCFSAVVPLHALCTIFDFNINRLPRRCLVPIAETQYAYLARSLRVKYMFVFPPNVSFLDRRDPVIHDGSIDTCDKLFLTDDEYSDFRINCTLNCKNRNEDFDGDTNNPSMCKGIESHTEIRYNMRTHLMPLLRNRHIFSQNILYRLFVILAVDPPYDKSFNAVSRDYAKSVEQDLYENVLRILWCIDIFRNVEAERRARDFFGPENYLLYELYMRAKLSDIHRVVNETDSMLQRQQKNQKNANIDDVNFDGNNVSNCTDRNDADNILNELYVDTLHKLDGVWKASVKSSAGNCFSIIDNMIRSMALVQGDSETTKFVDNLLRVTHDIFPQVLTGEEPLCFTTIVNVLSTAKGNFDDILLLQRNFEAKLQHPNNLNVSRALMDLLLPVSEQKLQQNKQYLDNFVYGSKKVPKNSKLAISTKWTLQNVIYYEGDLYIDGRIVLPDCFHVFSYELFMDIDVVCAIFDAVLLQLPTL